MRRFKGIYWRTFTVTVGMVALTLVLLGASFFALTYSYIMSEKRGELADKAEAIAQLAVTAYNEPSLLHSWDQTRRELKDLATVAERMSGTDFIIPPGSTGVRPTPASPTWASMRSPASWWPSPPAPPRAAPWWAPSWPWPSPTP